MAPYRVLLVDDSPVIHTSAGRLLASSPGVEVVGHAFSGSEAMGQTDRTRPDLVVMDLEMPGMNGLEATRRLLARPGAPRVIIMSLHDEPEYREAACEAGADEFVHKSELVQKLLPLISRLAGGHGEDGEEAKRR
jgi:DNA-binding NarL/FixJ family response regulator